MVICDPREPLDFRPDLLSRPVIPDREVALESPPPPVASFKSAALRAMNPAGKLAHPAFTSGFQSCSWILEKTNQGNSICREALNAGFSHMKQFMKRD